MRQPSFITVSAPGVLTFRSDRQFCHVRRPSVSTCHKRTFGRHMMCSEQSDSASGENRANLSMKQEVQWDTSEQQQSEFDDDEAAFIVNIEDDEYNDDFQDDDDSSLDGLTVVDVKAPQRRKKERPRISALLDAIATEPEPGTKLTTDADSFPDIQDDDIAKYVRTVVMAADMRKGDDILALRVSKITYIASFVIIITGKNPPQLRAIANLIEEDLSKKHTLEPRRVEGAPNSGWMLLDYGDLLINIFSPEQRLTYNLEKLWSRGEVMDISDCLVGPRDELKDITDGSLDDWLGDK